MSGPSASGARGLGRLAALFSLRTISGKLIVGLVLLFGVASVAVSAVTDHSLNQSLMSSLNQQLQAATDSWYSCVQRISGDADHDGPVQSAYRPAPGGYGMCSNTGQAPGTFELLLTGDSVGYKNTVKEECRLSGSDKAVLAALPSDASRYPSGQPSAGQPSAGQPSAGQPSAGQPSAGQPSADESGADQSGADQPGAGHSGAGPPGPPPASTHVRTLDSLGGEFLLTKVPGPEHGTALVTGLSMSSVQGTLEHVENTEHVVYAAVLVLALVLGTAMVQLSLRPLRRVAATATKVTELPLDSGEVMLPAGVPDSDPRTEVGRVGAAFNRMLFHVERALGRRAASEARLRRFAADASHELRTPLSAIRGYAELALRHPGPVPEEVSHALRRVQSESARMTVLVDDLLLLARLDAGRPLEREPVDLSRLAIEATSDARVARGDHRWRLDLPGEPVLVEGDEHRLHQVLANLLSNAGKHTPPGSTVSVALTLGDAAPGDAAPGDAVPGAEADIAAVQRGAAPPGPRVELSITDDGPGIAPELLPELFERFTRAEVGRARDATAAGRSTGLGLAIVDAVVAAHGGGIVVTSRPGMTRFAILLPLLREPAGQPEASRV